MNVFDLRDRLVEDYSSYTRSFIKIADTRISAGGFRSECGRVLAGATAPAQSNFCQGGTIDELVARAPCIPECTRIFRIDKSDTDHTGSSFCFTPISARRSSKQRRANPMS